MFSRKNSCKRRVAGAWRATAVRARAVGSTIGRVANRIAGCSFELDGVKYALSCNEKNYDTLRELERSMADFAQQN